MNELELQNLAQRNRAKDDLRLRMRVMKQQAKETRRICGFPRPQSTCAFCAHAMQAQCAQCGESVCKAHCSRWGSRAYGKYLCGNCGHRLMWTPQPENDSRCDALYLDPSVLTCLVFKRVEQKEIVFASLWDEVLA